MKRPIEEQLTAIEMQAARHLRQEQAGQCLTVEQLLDLVERRARSSQSKVWMMHLLGCDSCRATYEELRELQAMQRGERARWLSLPRWTPPLKWATPAAAAAMLFVWLRMALFHPVATPIGALVTADPVQPPVAERPIAVPREPNLTARANPPSVAIPSPGKTAPSLSIAAKPQGTRGVSITTLPPTPPLAPTLSTASLRLIVEEETKNLRDWAPSLETAQRYLDDVLALSTQLSSPSTRSGDGQSAHAIRLVSIHPEELAENYTVAPLQQPIELKFALSDEPPPAPLVVCVVTKRKNDPEPSIETIPLLPPDYKVSIDLRWTPGARYRITVLSDPDCASDPDRAKELYALEFRTLSDKALGDSEKSEPELLEWARQNQSVAPLVCALVLARELDRYGEALELLENARARYSHTAEFEKLIENLRAQVRHRREALRLPEEESRDAP